VRKSFCFKPDRGENEGESMLLPDLLRSSLHPHYIRARTLNARISYPGLCRASVHCCI
jgi:hypothetical protein